MTVVNAVMGAMDGTIDKGLRYKTGGIRVSITGLKNGSLSLLVNFKLIRNKFHLFVYAHTIKER